jgi:hypothetical protein
VASSEIHAVQTLSGNQPRMRRIIEEATQTFLPGTPVQLNAVDGGIQAWDGVTIAAGIAGFSAEPASNLTTLGTAKTLTFGAVPFEASAVNIPRGAPYNDGMVGFEVATDDNVFKGQVGPAQVAVAADLGKQYGMTKDADGHWYVDRTKNNPGVNTILIVTKLDPQDQSATPRGVYFQILTPASQMPG